MNKREFAIIASALRTYYPRDNIMPNEQALELWYHQLKDIPYRVAEAAVNVWVSTHKWSPSIAEIREQAAGLVSGERKEWGDAWEEVIKAIGRYGSYREQEALESFDPTTRAAVRSLGFRNLCMSENISVDRANFRMIYEQTAERERLKAQISPELKQLIADMPLLEKGG